MGRIAVVDDKDFLRDSLAATLQAAGHTAVPFPSADAALQRLNQQRFDLVVTDLKMPQMDGLAFLAAIKQHNRDIPVILMTAFGTVASAVEAMKQGAFDYVTKPFDADEIVLLTARALEHSQLVHDNEALRVSLRDCHRARALIGDSSAMSELSEKVQLVASSDATVLIHGESGTGKELVARAIHHASSRSDRPFLSVNCAALTASLLESELFGHEKGAFTGADKLRKGRFELAEGGTLLLDEISEIDLSLQAKLLRVLQERQYERVGASLTRLADVRVLATTNRDLVEWVKAGKFREDLYYRLNVVPIRVPALREHPEDIPLMVNHFLSNLNRGGAVAEASFETLQAYTWPGNVRELENLIERACVLSPSTQVCPNLIASWIGELPINASSAGDEMKLEEVEKKVICAALNRFDGHRQRSAKALGIGVRTLGMKIKRWDLDRVRRGGQANIAGTDAQLPHPAAEDHGVGLVRGRQGKESVTV